MKSLITSLMTMAVVVSQVTTAFALDKAKPTIVLDQVGKTVTLQDTLGNTEVLPAKTPLKNKRLKPGKYKVKHIPQCIKESEKCKVFEDGMFRPVEEQSFTDLGIWGSPNKVVYYTIYFVPVDYEEKDEALLPSFHSEIVPKGMIPGDNLKSRYATQGCVRLNYKDVKLLYTWILMLYQANIWPEIIVK
jgi:hypothetical protein